MIVDLSWKGKIKMIVDLSWIGKTNFLIEEVEVVHEANQNSLTSR